MFTGPVSAVTTTHTMTRDRQVETVNVAPTMERQTSPRSPFLGRKALTWMTGVILACLVLLVLVGNVQHLRGVPAWSNPLWNGDIDRSYAELSGNVMLLLAVVLLVTFSGLRRSGWAYGAWALTMLALVLDDYLMLHERGGEYLAQKLALPAVLNLRPVDLGELLVWAAEAFALGLVLVVAHLKSNPCARRDSWKFLALMVNLALFAVLVDMIHIAVQPGITRRSDNIFALAETAGELGAMALILLRCLWISLRSGPSAVGSGDGEGLPPTRR